MCEMASTRADHLSLCASIMTFSARHEHVAGRVMQYLLGDRAQKPATHQPMTMMAGDDQAGAPRFRFDDDAFSRIPYHHVKFDNSSQACSTLLQRLEQMMVMHARVPQYCLGLHLFAQLGRAGNGLDSHSGAVPRGKLESQVKCVSRRRRKEPQRRPR